MGGWGGVNAVVRVAYEYSRGGGRGFICSFPRIFRSFGHIIVLHGIRIPSVKAKRKETLFWQILAVVLSNFMPLK